MEGFVPASNHYLSVALTGKKPTVKKPTLLGIPIQVVQVASDHIEVSVHQDVYLDGQKREICWHYGGQPRSSKVL